jgi:hypothetical protein
MGNKVSIKKGGFDIRDGDFDDVFLQYGSCRPPRRINMYYDMVSIYFGVINKALKYCSLDPSRIEVSSSLATSKYQKEILSDQSMSAKPDISAPPRQNLQYLKDQSMVSNCFIFGCEKTIQFFQSNQTLVICFNTGSIHYPNGDLVYIQNMAKFILFLENLKQELIVIKGTTREIPINIVLCGHSNGMASATIISMALLYLQILDETILQQFHTIFMKYIQDNSKLLESDDNKLFDVLKLLKPEWSSSILNNCNLYVVGSGGFPVIFFKEEQFRLYYNLLRGRYLHCVSSINRQLINIIYGYKFKIISNLICQIIPEMSISDSMSHEEMMESIISTIAYEIPPSDIDDTLDYDEQSRLYSDEIKKVKENITILIKSKLEPTILEKINELIIILISLSQLKMNNYIPYDNSIELLMKFKEIFLFFNRIKEGANGTFRAPDTAAIVPDAAAIVTDAAAIVTDAAAIDITHVTIKALKRSLIAIANNIFDSLELLRIAKNIEEVPGCQFYDIYTNPITMRLKTGEIIDGANTIIIKNYYFICYYLSADDRIGYDNRIWVNDIIWANGRDKYNYAYFASINCKDSHQLSSNVYQLYAYVFNNGLL